MTPYLFLMFFQRDNYQYGNPKEKPDILDENLVAELRAWWQAVRDHHPSHDNPMDGITFTPYHGRWIFLHQLAVAYHVREQTGGDVSKVTYMLVRTIAHDPRTWPTCGYFITGLDKEAYVVVGERTTWRGYGSLCERPCEEPKDNPWFTSPGYTRHPDLDDEGR